MDLENISETKERLTNFTKRVASKFADGTVDGPAHFSSGNEEQIIKIFRGLRAEDYLFNKEAINYSKNELIDRKMVLVDEMVPNYVFEGIKPNDWVFSFYRNHYHALLKGIPETWIEENIMNGLSMHPFRKDYKFFTSAIVAGQIPIALGMAKVLDMKGSKDKVWAFVGDMGAESGVFHEATKYAHNNNLPITFVVEDNGLGVETPTETVWGGKGANTLPNVIKYYYQTGVPHQGVGKEVGF